MPRAPKTQAPPDAAEAIPDELPPYVPVRVTADAAHVLRMVSRRLTIEPGRLADFVLSMATGTLKPVAGLPIDQQAHLEAKDIAGPEELVHVSRDVWFVSVERIGARPATIGLVLSAAIARYATALKALPAIRARDISVLR